METWEAGVWMLIRNRRDVVIEQKSLQHDVLDYGNIMLHVDTERVTEHETQLNLVAENIKPQGFQVHVFLKACCGKVLRQMMHSACRIRKREWLITQGAREPRVSRNDEWWATTVFEVRHGRGVKGRVLEIWNE